jgi:hypothetical protein
MAFFSKLKGVGLLLKSFFEDVKDVELRSAAVGMNSYVDKGDDLHILFLDFDIVDEYKVKTSIREVQRFWGLSHCWLFRTRKGFHAFFFYDIMPYGRVRMVIEFARFVDFQFKYISRFYDYKTIRVAGKYKDKDIRFFDLLRGREPSEAEVAVGDLKKREHFLLLQS